MVARRVGPFLPREGWSESNAFFLMPQTSAGCKKVKANLHAAICRPDLSATINRKAKGFMYSASTAHAFFIVKTFL